jgi:hypothetical protein
MNEDNEEYEEVEYVEAEMYPEEIPQARVNGWDIARILALPALGLSQGFAKMFDQGYSLLIHLSEQYDAKKAAEEMEKALK